MSRGGIAVLVILAGFSWGCAKPGVTPPPPPVSTQSTILKIANTGEAAGNIVTLVLGVLCTAQPGQVKAVLSPNTCAVAKADTAKAVAFFGSVKAEVVSGDSWPEMKVKLASYGAGLVIDTAVSDPALKAELEALQVLVTQALDAIVNGDVKIP